MEDRVSIAFTGDIGFDKYMDKKWEDDELVSGEILEFLHSADHVVTNVEGPVSGSDKGPIKTSADNLKHTVNPEAIAVLEKIRADIWNINNNHIMDVGEQGLADTLKAADEAGVKTLGAGMNLDEASNPIIIDGAGGIGMIGVGYQRACRPASDDKGGCLSWSDMDTIAKRIEEIKEKCRWCVVVSHGGEEFTSLPNPYTRDRYIEYLNMGADIVVCHHPHVPMNYETFPGKAIFYSLGNFIFDTPYQRSQFNTEKGIVIKLNFSEDDFSFEALGIRIDREKERVVKDEIPKIFEDVQEEEYNRLAPLAAKMFIAATKRQQIYMNPGEYENADDEKWKENLLEPKRSGRVPGEVLDFYIVCPLAEKESEGAWKESRLTNVVDYILEQMQDNEQR